ncbi:hypothetical protein PIB30_062221 [Stylosanthes scabra]|uniref:Uncharacterized protein n=1 Tax=Stylosanthes scabra TaxID=79078 RepID=A0ABU6RLW4_9FABA|nr:hypothetical protein [Stylosanthes scabra]
MAQQEEGWPLGLRLLNARIGMVRNNNGDFSGSVSFTTILTSSTTTTPSIDSSSDLDTQEVSNNFLSANK